MHTQRMPEPLRKPGWPPLPWRANLGACLLALLCLLAITPALASGLQVSPILLEFSSTTQAQGLWLSNTGTQPLRAQVRVRAWTQGADGEQLGDTSALVASPAIVEIQPGKRQLVRIVRTGVADPGHEQAYRLLVNELPSATPESSPGLRFLLEYSVPVFLLPAGTTPALERTGPRKPADISRLQARFQHLDGNRYQLNLVNGGNQRLRLSQLTHVDGKGHATPLVPGLVGYVLAGAQMQWTLTLPAAAGTPGTLVARFNDDRDKQPLPLPAAAR